MDADFEKLLNQYTNSSNIKEAFLKKQDNYIDNSELLKNITLDIEFIKKNKRFFNLNVLIENREYNGDFWLKIMEDFPDDVNWDHLFSLDTLPFSWWFDTHKNGIIPSYYLKTWNEFLDHFNNLQEKRRHFLCFQYAHLYKQLYFDFEKLTHVAKFSDQLFTKITGDISDISNIKESLLVINPDILGMSSKLTINIVEHFMNIWSYSVLLNPVLPVEYREKLTVRLFEREGPLLLEPINRYADFSVNFWNSNEFLINPYHLVQNKSISISSLKEIKKIQETFLVKREDGIKEFKNSFYKRIWGNKDIDMKFFNKYNSRMDKISWRLLSGNKNFFQTMTKF